jgi:hypothetical protein
MNGYEMGGPCSMRERNEKFIQSFSRRACKGDFLGDPDVDGRTILKCILEKQGMRVKTELI